MVRGLSRALCVLAVLSLPDPARAAGDLSRLGPEIPVNTRTQGTQALPAVAVDPAGNFVVIWLGPDAAGVRQVLGQRFDTAGARRGGELQISSGNGVAERPQVAMDPEGGFVAVWTDRGVRARFYDRNGNPKGEEFAVNTPAYQAIRGRVAVNGRGEVLFVWSTGSIDGIVFARRYDLQGRPSEEPVPIRSHRDLSAVTLGLAAAPDGDFLATWSEPASPGNSDVWMRRFDAGSGTWGDPVQVTAAYEHLRENNYAPLPVFRPDGSFFLVWTYLRSVLYPSYSFPQVFARSYDAGGSPVEAAPVWLYEAYNSLSPATAVALDRNGNALILAAETEEGEDNGNYFFFDDVEGRLFDRSWRLLTDQVPIHDPALANRSGPAIAAGAKGDLVAVWHGQLLASLPHPPPVGNDGDSWGIFGQRLGPARCAAGSDVLCLGPGGRFEVQVSWKVPATGETGAGHSHSLTADTGAFWFFGPDNLELMIKVLDGRPVNGYFWVFYGALSNVEYTITVTDTVTRREKVYHNPAGQFASRSDITAFPDSATLSSAEEAMVAALPPPQAAAATAGCVPSAESLCLSQGRFQVQVEFTDPNNGTGGRGRTVPLTADTGAFWFFGPENLELMIKVLDARVVNGHYWVFYGALSDVAYTITVTDTATGQSRTYRNEHGHFASRSDLEAFPAGAR